MVARRDGPRGVARCDWASRQKWPVVADKRPEDAIADNEPPAEELGKYRCDAWALPDVEEETATGVEAIVDVEG
jgi:hypothetical protein